MLLDNAREDASVGCFSSKIYNCHAYKGKRIVWPGELETMT